MQFWRGLQALDGLSVCYRDARETAHPGEAGHTFTRGNLLVAEGNVAWDVAGGSTTSWCAATSAAPLDIASCERIFDQPVDGVWASDHFDVVADLEVHRPHG